MKNKDYIEAITKEVAAWPGVEVEIVEGGKHPAAKLKFGGKMLKRPFAGTPSDSAFGIHQMLGDMRRTMKQLGAERSKPEPSKEEDEAPYRKPNDGAAKRQSPVRSEPVKAKPDVADQLVAAGAATPERANEARAQRVVEAAKSARAIQPIDDVTAAALGETPEEGEARRAAIKEAAAAVVDGIYFGMTDAVYHSVPRLSSSGIQRLCVSPATFWRGSWLDPDKPDLDEWQTAAQLLGKAYHCARLEPDRFHSAYCRKPEKADYEGQNLITSDTAVKAALKEAGETQTIGTETIVERAERLVEAGEDRPIWALIMDEFERGRGERVAIDGRHFDQITQDMQRVRGVSDIAELLIGGAAEVSVFWSDQDGLKWKCRFDYLTPTHWADFKTFDNSRGKVLEQALADAVRFNRYYVQAVIYRDGAEAVRTGGLQIMGEASDEQRALIATLQIRGGELDCWFVFQEKKGIPNLLARQFPFYDVPLTTQHIHSAGATEDGQAEAERAGRTRSGLFARGAIDVRHAKDQFVLYATAYDPGTPWFPLNAKGRFSDMDFNSYWLEGKD